MDIMSTVNDIRPSWAWRHFIHCSISHRTDMLVNLFRSAQHPFEAPAEIGGQP